MQASLERLRRRREELDGQGGFTLIELLIVIVILGILAAIVVFAVQSLTSQSVTAACGSDYKNVETALESYKAQVGHYPSVGTVAGGAGQPAVTGDNWATGPGQAQTTTAAGTVATFTDGLQALYATQTGVDGSTVGPWLKDAPQNGNSYRIYVVPGGQTAGNTGYGGFAADGTVLLQNLAKQPLSLASPIALTNVSNPTDNAAGTLTLTSGKWVPSTTTGANGINLTCSDAGL